MLPIGRFTDFIAQNQLFEPADTVLAAISGGVDSVLMARLLHTAGFKFAMAHCNFQLRGADADADQEFCRELAKELKVQLHTISFDTTAYAAQHKVSVQMAARNLRYEWFEQLRVQNAYTAITLAHHQNDAIETILLNLTRGSGIAGLHGILPKNGHLARPMLFLTRQEIEEIAQQNNIYYKEDASNASTKYARNKIRLEVLPKLKELNPSLEKTFEHNLQRFRELEHLLQLETERQKVHFVQHGDELHLPIQAVKNMNPQRLLLFSLLQPYGFNQEHIDSIISSLDKHSGRQFETGEYRLVLDRGYFILSKKHQSPIQQVLIDDVTKEVIWGDQYFTFAPGDSLLIVKHDPMIASIDADLLVYPLTVRAWRHGDHFYPLGMKGKQMLSDYFIHQKLPLHQKNQVPILVNGNGNLIWVVGYRLDDRYKVTDKTKKLLYSNCINHYER